MDDEDVMLTTVDNPWDPFTHYDEWLSFDESEGYYSLPLLGRVAITSDEMSDELNNVEIVRAINEIVSENISGMHKKVYRNSEKIGAS